MIQLSEAQEIVMAHVAPGPVVEFAIGDVLNRTLAASIISDVDQPPFDRSVMDGYAVRAEDVFAAPVTLRVVGQIPAGTTADRSLQPGEAMQINTGAPMPPGADAVVRVEHTTPGEGGDFVEIRESVACGNFITTRATYRSAGDQVLAAGMVMTPVEIGVAASVGASRLPVYARPVVSVLVTGDELVDIDRKPHGAQIRNSNQHLLEALIRSAHADPLVVESAGDDKDLLRTRIEQGLRADVLCLTGGISMGAFDFVPEVLISLGARFHIHKIAIKPGRPTIFATMPDGTLVFALPGNPTSALIGFELLVRPALAARQGRPNVFPSRIQAILNGTLSATRDRQTFIPAKAEVDGHGRWVTEAVSWHGSGDALGVATVNAFIVRPPQRAKAEDGAAVSIILLDRMQAR